MTTEPIDIPISTDYDDQGAKDAISDAEKLEDLSPTVTVDADATDAKAGLDEVHGIAQDLIDRNPWIAEVLADTDKAKADIDTIQTDLNDIDSETVSPQIDTSGMQKMSTESGKAKDASHSLAGAVVGDSIAASTGLGALGESVSQVTEGLLAGEVAMSELAVAGLTMGGITLAMGALQRGAKQAAEATKDLGDEIKSLSTASDEAALNSLSQMMIDQFVAGKDLADIWQRITDGNVEGARRLVALMQAQGATAEQTKGLTDAIGKHDEAMAQGAKTSKEFGDQTTETGDAAELTGEQILQQSRNTDLTRQATERAAKWEEEHAKALADAEKASADLTKSINDYRKAISGSDWGESQIQGAISGMESFTSQHNALIDIAATGEKAFDDFTAAVKDNGLTFDITTDAGRKNQTALEDLSKTLDLRLGAAYTEADGNQTTFTENATKLADDTLGRLQREMGLSDDATAELGAQLGLLPGDIQTRYEFAGNAIAMEQLGLLQSAINDLPDDVQTTVTQKILVGDYVGAVDTVQGYFDSHQVTITASINQAKLKQQIAAAQGGLQAWIDRLVPGGTKAAATATTVNVNLPRGARHGDIARAMGLSTRRNGRRYGNPSGVVSYARH